MWTGVELDSPWLPLSRRTPAVLITRPLAEHAENMDSAPGSPAVLGELPMLRLCTNTRFGAVCYCMGCSHVPFIHWTASID